MYTVNTTYVVNTTNVVAIFAELNLVLNINHFSIPKLINSLFPLLQLHSGHQFV